MLRKGVELDGVLFGQQVASAVVAHLEFYARSVSVKYVWFKSRTRMTLPHSSHQSTYLQLASKLAQPLSTRCCLGSPRNSLWLRRLSYFGDGEGLRRNAAQQKERYIFHKCSVWRTEMGAWQRPSWDHWKAPTTGPAKQCICENRQWSCRFYHTKLLVELVFLLFPRCSRVLLLDLCHDIPLSTWSVFHKVRSSLYWPWQ